ncbi:MAG: recombination mediator RecR [Candidatus Omnitrophica bacterium]|nr:recombination mediator RecR [Candidatus Omnitrophota bacterium]
MGFPKIFHDLIESLSQFPGVGRRSAERMAFYILKMQPKEVSELARRIEDVQKFIKPCALCNNFSTEEICSLCSSPKREKDVLCIVEEPKDIMAIEKTSQYNGLYYVLLGSISPLDGIEDLNIGKLLRRIASNQIKEVIISTDPDNDGELTAQFLIQKLSPYKVKIYRIAIGIPLGTQIEYIDSATLGKALMDRKPV